MKRRGFLKFAAAGGTVGFLASPIIWNTLYDAVYWTQNWGWIPRLKKGKNEYIPTVSKLCPSGTGFLVRTVDGNPVRTIGDKNNPITHGSTTALALAEAQLRVSPARLKEPLKRTADGAYVAISWNEAEKLLKNTMEKAGSSLAVLSGDNTSSINEVLSAIVRKRGSSDMYFMPNGEQSAQYAWTAMGGQGRPGYDIENSDCILSVGAPILENWGVVASNRSAFNRSHPIGGTPTQKFIYASIEQSNTAAAADIWLPFIPRTGAVLLLGIANLLIQAGKKTFAPGLQNFAALAAQYSLEKVTEITGVPADRLKAAVKALLEAKKPLVITGSTDDAFSSYHPLALTLAFSINMLLGNIGKEGGIKELPFPTTVVNGAMEYRDILKNPLYYYSHEVAAGKKQASKFLLIYSANPVYSLPSDFGIKETIKKSGFSVAVASFMTETCAECDLVLPAALGMEAFDDVQTPYGSGTVTYALARPIVQPFGNARSAGELFIALAQELKIDLGVKDMPELLYKKAYSLGAPFRNMLENGKVFIAEVQGSKSLLFYNWEKMNISETILQKDTIFAAAGTFLAMGTPNTGIPPFATKTIQDFQLRGSLSVAQMNSATAKKLKVQEGDILQISSSKAAAKVSVAIFEGIANNAICLPVGLGHTAFDQFSRGKGINTVSLMEAFFEADSNLCVWGPVPVKAVKA